MLQANAWELTGTGGAGAASSHGGDARPRRLPSGRWRSHQRSSDTQYLGLRATCWLGRRAARRGMRRWRWRRTIPLCCCERAPMVYSFNLDHHASPVRQSGLPSG